TCEQSYFRVSDSTAAVIMGMEGDDDSVTVFQMVAHVLDLVCEDMGGRKLDGDREVDDCLVVGSRFPDIENGVADFQRVVRLGTGEGFGRVFKPQIGVGSRLKF